MKSNSGIYKIINIKNGKFYIGSAVNFEKRKRNHFNLLKRNVHDNIHLQRAYNKYGSEYFIFEIIECVEDKNILIEREQYWIDFYGIKNIYNICSVAGNTFGRRHSEKTKKKIGIKSIGRKFDTESKNIQSLKAKERIKNGTIKGLFTTERMAGGKNPAARKVICLETKEIFETTKAAGEKYSISRQAIGKNCGGYTKICAGLHWMYLEDYNKEKIK